jgi:peptidoglycan/xylan/chitin deacetylase (PgdA/CDA1 family)
MPILSIMFHDVVEEDRWDSSGFPGGSAALYKLSRKEFEKHLDAIHAVLPAGSVKTINDLDHGFDQRCVFLTFDDGGICAHTIIADLLEQRGWRGHFFIPTLYIGTPGFLNVEHLVDLHRRGHIIGSHSSSHPTRITSLSDQRIADEWRESVRTLSQILGTEVTSASMPQGYYSRRLLGAAREAGIRTAFTSDPTMRVGEVSGCITLGRYMVQRGMDSRISAELAQMRFSARFRQATLWKLKRVAKIASGDVYIRVREHLLSDK